MEKVDKKDGTFEELKKCKPKYRSEPVEDDKCRYTVQRWKEIDRVQLTGTGLAATWPSQNVPPPTAMQTIGARRAGKRTEKLILDFGKQSCEVKDAAWRKYTDNASYKVEVRARSGDVVCDSL